MPPISFAPPPSRPRRRLPPPELPKPAELPTPHATRHYTIPPFRTPTPQAPTQHDPTWPFPATLPSATSSSVLSTKTSQDKMQEETWGPKITLSPLPAKLGKRSKKQRQKEKHKRHMKMCASNGYQPRKDGSKPGDAEQKLQRAESGSTESITTESIEKLVDGGERKTLVTYARIVVVVEEKVVDKYGKVVVGAEDVVKKDEESSSDDSDEEKVVSESSDDEYFDEKRCEWRPKSEIRKKIKPAKQKKSDVATETGPGTAVEKEIASKDVKGSI